MQTVFRIDRIRSPGALSLLLALVRRKPPTLAVDVTLIVPDGERTPFVLQERDCVTVNSLGITEGELRARTAGAIDCESPWDLTP